MKIKHLNIHYTFWGVICFFPAFKWTSGGTALGQKLLHLTCFGLFTCLIIAKMAYMLTSESRLQNETRNKHIVFSILCFAAMSCYAMFVLVFIAPLPSLSGLSDIARPFVYSLYFLIPLIFPLKNDDLQKIMSFLFLLAIFQILFSGLVYVEGAWPLVDLFKGRMSNDEIIYHFFRWSGTFVYPSDFTFFLSFLVYYCFYKVSFGCSKKEKFRFTAFLLILLLAMVMSLSRGGIASIVFMMGLFYLISKAKRSVYVNLWIFLITTVLISSFIFLMDSEYAEQLNIEYILASFDSKGPDASTLHRIIEFQLAIDYSTQYFPFGVGGHRETLANQVGVIESYYGHNLIRGGWIGLLFSLFFILYIIINARLMLKCTSDIKLRAFLWSAILVIASVPLIFGFSSAMSDRFKCLPFYYLICGYVIMVATNKELNRYQTSAIFCKKLP